jgi:hypothetical protein
MANKQSNVAELLFFTQAGLSDTGAGNLQHAQHSSRKRLSPYRILLDMNLSASAGPRLPCNDHNIFNLIRGMKDLPSTSCHRRGTNAPCLPCSTSRIEAYSVGFFAKRVVVVDPSSTGLRKPRALDVGLHVYSPHVAAFVELRHKQNTDSEASTKRLNSIPYDQDRSTTNN